MNNNRKYFLLIIDKEKESEKFDFDLIKTNFSYQIKDNVIEGLFDLILDLQTLELLNYTNKEMIIKLSTLNDINKNLDLIKQEIKKFDFDVSLAKDMLGGSDRVFKNILLNYLEEYKGVDQKLNQFLENSEFDEIRKIVHKIKGVSLYLGSEKLLNYATSIEEKVYNGSITKDLVLDFIEYHNRIEEYVKEQVQNV